MRHLATDAGATAIYLFIAELNGFKEGTPAEKEAFGIECYLTTHLHELDADIEDDRKEMHENIWLERLYAELDSYYELTDKPYSKKKALGHGTVASLLSKPRTDYKWTVPIELDASASQLQLVGVLLGDSRLLTMTNVIGDTLSDPWNFEGIPRTQFKHAATPMLYGSSKACHELWQDKGHKYTVEQVRAFNQELSNGALGVANQFKEFIINNVKPRPVMTVQIMDEVFEIECNRFRNVGEETIAYDIYDSTEDRVRRIAHTNTKKVPDMDQFRRYFATLLVHNLDSQIANSVMSKVMDKYGWGIDIHDAFVVNPEAAADVRTWYGQELQNIYDNRTEILQNYLSSIGIGQEAQAQWETLRNMVHPVSEFSPQAMALK